MDLLFKGLPRDLQWEILSEFVGTHVVRNGKLMRKIVYIRTDSDDITGRQIPGDKVLPIMNPIRVRQRLSWLHHRDDVGYQYVRFFTDAKIKFCEDAITGDTIFCCREVRDYTVLWKCDFTHRTVDDVILAPFVKHSYPSYEHTNKKRRIPLVRWIDRFETNSLS